MSLDSLLPRRPVRLRHAFGTRLLGLSRARERRSLRPCRGTWGRTDCYRSVDARNVWRPGAAGLEGQPQVRRKSLRLDGAGPHGHQVERRRSGLGGRATRSAHRECRTRMAG